MADRYDDYDRSRERYGDWSRGFRDAGRRYDDARREASGESHSGRDSGDEFDREDRDRAYSREGRIFSRPGEMSGERWRSETGWGGYGGGMGSYGREDWRTGRYGGGIGYGTESWNRGESPSYGSGFSFGRQSHSEKGRFTGRGPRGYRRSDDRIMEDVCERLTQHPDVDASEIDVRVAEGQVTLTGSVEDRHQKRAAEDIVEEISGVRDVHNELKISKGLGQRIGESLGISEKEPVKR